MSRVTKYLKNPSKSNSNFVLHDQKQKKTQQFSPNSQLVILKHFMIH